MTEQTDLFGGPAGPKQQSLFGDEPDRLKAPSREFLPSPDRVRKKLLRVLNEARAAKTMPWSEHETRMWQTVFPQMANWLPEEEAAQLRLEFSSEIARLKSAA
ncbi:MAG: hypothetical protein ACOZAA_16875 [Pseudomonadota bacterium]